MEDRGRRKSKLLIKLEHHQSIFGFRPTHNPKVAGSNPAPATNLPTSSLTSNSLLVFVLRSSSLFSSHPPQTQHFRPFLTVF